MKWVLCIATVAVISATMSSTSARADQFLYLAAQQDKRVDTYAIDARTGELTKKFSHDIPGNAGPMVVSPDGQYLYVESTTPQKGKKPLAEVVTFKRLSDGSLEFTKVAEITNRTPYLKVDKTGTILMASHYGEGEVTVYRIEDGICTGELLDRKVTNDRAHSVETDPSGKFVYVPHTSPNRVYQFSLDPKSGKLTPLNPPFAEGPDADHLYHEPRHYAHHPTLNMGYTSNERGGGISAWAFDPKAGTLTLKQTLSTLPPESDGKSAAADIHITPNGRFVYVSNRDVSKVGPGEKGKDTLAGFEIDPKTGSLKLVGYFPTERLPRSFTIDQTGKFVYSAGQQSSKLAAYRIDQESGKLEQFATYDVGTVPIWVMCVED